MNYDPLEYQILNNLIHNESYTRKIIPFLLDEYFQNNVEKTVFKTVKEYIDKYNKLPSTQEIKINIDELVDLPEETHKEVHSYLNLLEEHKKVNQDWLIDKTEKWCQEKAIHNSILTSIHILDGKTTQDKGIIPDLLTKALGVSFDANVGHDFMDNFAQRFEFYHRKEERVPFDIDILNKITKGGLPKKTLNVILAGTGVGKSLAMCHMASANLLDGKNVLYITMEMAEERIAERIDANLLDVPLDDIEKLSQDMYYSKIERLKKKNLGKLIIKEYPTACAGSSHFRHLLNELKLKKDFIPDIIYIDYLNICVSVRIKPGANVNSYTYVKAIAEELRGLAVEMNVPIVTATQTTRSGFTNSDPGLEDTSESFGLPATADFFIVLVSTEELQNLNQIMVKQLKNRYSDISTFKRFVVGIDRSKMRLYDCEDSAQTLTQGGAGGGGISTNPTGNGGAGGGEDKPVFGNSSFGQKDEDYAWAPRRKSIGPFN